MYYDTRNRQAIATLCPTVQAKANLWLAECEKQGVWLLITEGYRSWAQQAIDYAKGRWLPGPIVTYAKPGQSYHNWKIAFDFVPSDGQGNLHYEDMNRYLQAIAIAKQFGLESGHDWPPPKTDTPHLQYTEGHDINWFRAGGKI